MLIGALTLVVVAIAVGFALPGQASVERRIVIERPAATVFTVLNGFRHFRRWSPWEGLDPAMQQAVEGPISGVGARYSWSSQMESVGEGSRRIVGSMPYRRIEMELDLAGTDAVSTSRFELEPKAGGTEVTWIREVQFSGLLERYRGLLLEGRQGPDQERGLAQLKAHVESLPDVDFSDITVERIEVRARPIAYVSGRSNTEPVAIARAYDKAFAQVTAALSRDGVKPAGPPLAIGRRWDAGRRIYEFDAAIPVPRGTAKPRTDRNVKIGMTYAGTVLHSVHRGPHDGQGTHLRKLMAYKQAAGFESNGSPWDVYIADTDRPGAVEVTETYVPVR